MNKQNGFTLVEIAIVMVIIGLLLGGVLKGQEIVTNAKIKNLENDFSGITAAIYSYQDRYRALPGDDARATARFGTTAPSNGILGDGNIDGAALVQSGDESGIFWSHLRSAGLVEGDSDDSGSPILPINSFGGVTGVSSDAIASDPKITKGRTYIGFSKIPNSIAGILESRSDDEKPDKGSIRASKGIGGSATTYDGLDDDVIREVYFIL